MIVSIGQSAHCTITLSFNGSVKTYEEEVRTPLGGMTERQRFERVRKNARQSFGIATGAEDAVLFYREIPPHR